MCVLPMLKKMLPDNGLDVKVGTLVLNLAGDWLNKIPCSVASSRGVA